jgi:hypothetical protein
MRILDRTGSLTRSVLTVLILVGVVAVPDTALAGSGAAGSCQATDPKPASPGTKNTMLNGIAVTTGCIAWAVGSYSDGGPARLLIERFDGHQWTVQHLPVRSGQLNAVAARSPDDAYAVGFSGERSLILHWDGTTWHKMATGVREKHSPLAGVAVDSASDAWAVGTTPARAGLTKTLIVHWNGRHWIEMPSPNGDHQQINDLSAVTATSPKDAWAVGLSEGQTEDSLLLHWNGVKWKRAAGLEPGDDSSLSAVTSLSPKDVWAVGNTHSKHRDSFSTFIERWNGKKWLRVPSPTPLGDRGIIMTGVAAGSASRIWAVGWYLTQQKTTQLFMEQWNGVYWQQVDGPDPSETNDHFGGIATMRGNTWTVGFFAPGRPAAPHLVAFARRVT